MANTELSSTASIEIDDMPEMPGTPPAEFLSDDNELSLGMWTLNNGGC